MSFLLKSMVSSQVKNLGLGGGEEVKKEDGAATDPAAAAGMTREEYEEYQRQVVEENFPDGKTATVVHAKANTPRNVAGSDAAFGYDEGSKLYRKGMERDATFAHKKAERASLRVHLRQKYRLPKSEQDENAIQMAGDDIDVPEELRKMVDRDAVEEEEKDSILGQIQNIQNMDMDTIKEKAQATFSEMKQAAEQKCLLM